MAASSASRPGPPGPRLVVVGSANTDLVCRCTALPAPGETVLGGEFVRAAGGKGANQAVAAARLGAQVTFVASLGDDDLGDAALAGYLAEGLNCDHLARRAGQPSGVALICVDQRGENQIVVAPGANSALAAEQVHAAAAAVASAAGLLAQLEVPLEAVQAAADLAAAHGVPFMLNPAPLPPDGLPHGLLARCSALVPNQTEAEGLLGRPLDGLSEADLAAALRALGPETVVLTRGARGALLVEADSQRAIAAPRVQAVDTTAAGDAFCGALLVARAEGRDWPAAVAWACAAGALAATRLGAQPSLPRRAEVDQLAAAGLS